MVQTRKRAPSTHRGNPTDRRAGPVEGNGRRPSLGLTGFAIAALVSTGLGLPLSGGYLALDMVMVLIGFELARRVGDVDRDRHWLKRFWLGCVARIGPPVLVAVALVTLYWSWDQNLDEARIRAVLGGVTMTLNFFRVSGGARFVAIEHLWAIGVIAQFTLLVPVLVVAGPKTLGRSQRAAIIVGLAAGVALGRLALLVTEAADPATIAIHTVSRIDGLLVGLAIGLLPRRTLQRIVPAQYAAPAFAALLFLLAVAPDPGRFPMLGLGLLIAVTIGLTAVVLTASATVGLRGALAATVDNQMMWWLGARALSFYVWTQVFAVALEVGVLEPVDQGHTWPGPAIFLIQIVFGLAAAATSHRYVEVPVVAAIDGISDRSGSRRGDNHRPTHRAPRADRAGSNRARLH